jgi:NtrC-family two-component system sensor histidine kinase KinB
MINALERQDSAILLAEIGEKEWSDNVSLAGESRFFQWLARSKDNITIAGEKEILNEIESSYLVFRTLLQKSDIDYAQDIYPVFQNVRTSCEELRQLNQDTMYTASAHAERIASGAVRSMSLLGGVFLFLGFGFAFFISYVITRPLREMIDATGRIAEGNYNISLQKRSKDELGRLSQSINEMSAKLKRFHELNIGEIMFEKRRSDAVIRSIDDGIVLVNDKLEIVGMNPAAEEIFSFHYRPDEQIHFMEVIRDEKMYNRVKAVSSGSFSAEQEEYFLHEQEQQRRFYNYSVTPVLVGKKVLGTVLVLRDITRLKEVDRLKSEFIMTASHELRTPLTGIAMSIDLLKESLAADGKADDREIVEVASEEISRLRQLLSDLLDLSRIESGRIELDILPVDVHSLIDGACTHLGISEQETLSNGAVLRFSGQDIEARVMADTSKTVWVLSNLITNSLKYATNATYLEISVRKGKQFLFITVSDDGPGIPMDFRKRIFDKFVRVGAPSDPGGTGLGLSICKEMIRAQHGTIWFEESEGGGSRFTFTLPLSDETEEENGNENEGNSDRR